MHCRRIRRRGLLVGIEFGENANLVGEQLRDENIFPTPSRVDVQP